MASFCEYFADNAKSTLAAPCNAGDLTITIANISLFPSLTPFRLRVENEIMVATAVVGNTCTVTRAQESTLAVFHPTNSEVANVFTLGSLNNSTLCYSQEGAFASRPLPDDNFAGQFWFNDSPGFYLSRNDGASYEGWEDWGPLFAVTEPTSTGFSWINQNTAMVSTTNGGLSFIASNLDVNPSNLMMYIQSLPGFSPYTFTMGFIPTIYPINQGCCGLVLRESSTQKAIFMRLLFDTTVVTRSDVSISIDKYSNPTTPAGNYVVQSASMLKGPLVWFQINNDSSNLNFGYSNNNVNYTQMFSSPITDYFTLGPNQIGFCISSESSLGYTAMTVLHFG